MTCTVDRWAGIVLSLILVSWSDETSTLRSAPELTALSSLRRIAFTQDLVVWIGSDNCLKSAAVRNGQLVDVRVWGADEKRRVALSGDSAFVLEADSGGTLIAYKPMAGEAAWRISLAQRRTLGMNGDAMIVAFQPAANLVCFADADKLVVMDTQGRSRREIRSTGRDFTRVLTAADISADGQSLVIAMSFPPYVLVYSLLNGEVLYRSDDAMRYWLPLSVAFGSNSREILVGRAVTGPHSDSAAIDCLFRVATSGKSEAFGRGVDGAGMLTHGRETGEWFVASPGGSVSLVSCLDAARRMELRAGNDQDVLEGLAYSESEDLLAVLLKSGRIELIRPPR